MRGLRSKILIILLVIATCFTFSACDFSGVWDYFIGSFPSSDLFNPSDSGSSGGNNQSPSRTDGEVHVNQGTAESGSGGLADVIEVIAPTVVEITTVYSYNVNGRLEQFASRGSGVIVKKNTDSVEIITNEHVVEKGSNFTDEYNNLYIYQSMYIAVTVSSGREYSAVKLYGNADKDVALLKVLKTELKEEYDLLTVASIPESYSIVEGERVVAIGNPLGTLGGTVTAGIVSAIDRDISVEGKQMTLLQIDASINQGNSGGGLFDESGKLIGIVNAKIAETGVEGIGFAIPIVTAIDTLKIEGYLTDIVCEKGE